MMALKYKEGKSIPDHVSEFQSMRNQLLGMSVKLDEILGLWLLATLPNSWETFWVSLINSASQGIITLDLAKSSVLNEDVRRRSQDSTSQPEVLVIKNMGETKTKMNKGGGDKHDRNDDEKSESVAIATCEDLRIICDENLINLACDESSWVIDTGASIHVTSRKDFFTSYTLGDFGVLKIGSDGLVPVTSMGDVRLVRNNGTKLTLKDVRHAPDFHWNLIYARKLDDEGFCNTFSEGQWKLTKGSLVVARRKKSSNFYLMQASTSRDTVNVTVNNNSTELWHKRLCHTSENGINCLAKNNKLSSLKNATLKTKLWVYTLKLKGQVFEAFKQFRASFERKTGKKLKCICTDNGDAKLPRSFWAEALNTTTHVINLSPSVPLQDNGVLTDVNLVPLNPSSNHIQDDVHGDVNDDQQDIGDFDVPIDNVVNDQQQASIAPPAVPLCRSSRDQRPSVIKKGIDFEETFSTVVKMSSIRTILSLASCYDLEVEQMDVKNALLHSDLEEELYMEQSEGFVAQEK
ncbi:hypothetical protein GQ457_18G003870 [Hibiscus cannabinus]